MKKYNCNENYFTVPTLENSYWAGFIAADGWIIERKKSQNLLGIKISVKDKIILEDFKNYIEFTGPIFDIPSCDGGITNGKVIKGGHSVTMTIICNKICEDLWNVFKIGPRKSLTHEPPNGLTFEQELAFIIGYIDGDGWIGLRKNYMRKTGQVQRDKYPMRIGFAGTEKYLEWVNLKIHQLSMSHSQIKPYKQKNIYKLETSGKFAYDVLKLLENISVPKLDRKWSTVRNFEPIGL